MRVRIGSLVALVLQVVDIAQNGLENQEDYNRDAEDGMEGAELGEERQSASATLSKLEDNKTYISRSFICNIHP